VNRPALLVAGHGSRDQAGAAELFALVDRVRALAPELTVECGFIELSPPPLSVAAGDLVAAGARDVVVVPLMLLAAGHVKDDIPALLARCRLEHPGVRFRYARDLGIHPDLLAIVEERLAASVPADLAPETAVLLVGRGSSDPDANADLHKIARLLYEGRPYPLVEACFVGITGPRVPEGLERCRRLGASRIVAVPYFLFTGRLELRIRAQCAAFAAGHPDLQVRVAGYLGPDERIARLVLARYAEVLDGDPRMNCDLCVHRVALPGFEARVGAPATPALHLHDQPLPTDRGGRP
jgi:sirohydrochlorin cobaltochelatase